jgi:hypothetical protein
MDEARLSCGRPSAGRCRTQGSHPWVFKSIDGAVGRKSAFEFPVLPSYLWAVCGRSDWLRRVAHRACRAFVVSDARPSPWKTLRRLQRWTWHFQTCYGKSEAVLASACRGSYRVRRAGQASWPSLAPTNSPDEAHFLSPSGACADDVRFPLLLPESRRSIDRFR